VPQDYSGKTFWSDFIPDDASGDISLNMTITASSGLLDIVFDRTETLKIDGKPGTIFLRVVSTSSYPGTMTMVAAINIPVVPYPTVTRIP
jgi:hypothetical protein